jgi:hypothetical protein
MDLDYIKRKAAAVPLALQNAAAKEALQECLLAALARKGALAQVLFHGGTALRILHGLPRYSEDLDFVCESRCTEQDMAEWSSVLSRAISTVGAIPHIGRPRIDKVAGPGAKQIYGIHLAATSPSFAKFAKDGLQISVEVDLTPPSHSTEEVKTVLVADEPVTIPTLTLPSLMAGKLHILLTRMDREKGRDWYDYLWYRKRSVTPNVPHLQSAIDQTAPGLDAAYWMSHLRERAKAVNWPNVRSDVSPFLEDKNDAQELTESSICGKTPFPDFTAMHKQVLQSPDGHLEFGGRNVRASIDQACLEGDEAAMDLRKAIFDREVRKRINGPEIG